MEQSKELINITYNVYADANGRDPDTYSKTLNTYHKLLWNKPLPSSKVFGLSSFGRKKFFLFHKTEDMNLILSSDSIIHPYHYWTNMKPIIQNISKEEINAFQNLGSTIGGYVIFPAKRINNQLTINAKRGMHGFISDRFDFTLECIRRWYIAEESPLYDCLERYKDFFKLFESFKNYIDFFLLNDLVDANYMVKFWLPFEEFGVSMPLPKNADEYYLYMNNVMIFVHKRNQRILNWVKSNLKESHQDKI